MKKLGKAKFNNFDGFVSWQSQLDAKHSLTLWQNHIYARHGESHLTAAFDHLYPNWNHYPRPDDYRTAKEKLLQKFSSVQEYLVQTNQCWDVLLADNDLMVISYGQVEGRQSSDYFCCYLIESWRDYINYTPFADYDSIPIGQLHQMTLIGGGEAAIGGNTSLLPKGVADSISLNDVKTGIIGQKEKLRQLQDKIKAVEDGETEELLPIKKKMQELEQKLKAMQQKKLAELNALKESLNAKKEEMEKQIFVLESEIYAIRCFLGETIEFVKLRSGENAPLEQPVVLYQKFRYMVEDLGKFAIMWPDEKIGDSIEKALASSDALLEAFAPSTKCITLIRHSESGVYFSEHEAIHNALDSYKRLHGTQIAILIRNGENLYIGWTDEDKISLKDDFFLKPGTSVSKTPLSPQRENESDAEYEWRLQREDEQIQAANKNNMMQALSRHFLFSILNGVAATENSILPLPEFTSRAERARHILYSMADGSLEDNRFGSFMDILAKCNAVNKKGDMILTTQSLTAQQPKHYYMHAYHNDRGRGEANRTHDVHCKDCTIYPINMVEPEYFQKIRYQQDGTIYTTSKENACNLSEDCEIQEHFTVTEEHFFISLEKQYCRSAWYGENVARANFEVYPHEFINLTYMNSCWLNYILSTKNVHGWNVGGKAVDYAYALPYISAALNHIREREKEEASNITTAGGKSLLTDPDWPVALSEWKISKGVRNLTEYQAKRFVKDLLAGKDDAK